MPQGDTNPGSGQSVTGGPTARFEDLMGRFFGLLCALLQTEMVKYLFEDGDVQIEGYVPPSQG